MSARLALITGASAGIGAAFARVYAAHGYDLAITARRRERLEALAEEIRGRHGLEVIVAPADLADPAAPAAILAAVGAQGRGVDALVNNAGYGLVADFARADWAAHRSLLQVMSLAPLELTHGVLAGMLERRFGRIVNVASLAGLIPGAAGASLYGPIKALLVRFSQALHVETQGSGVHVSVLCPGYTESEFHDADGARALMGENTARWLWQGADEVAAAGYEAGEANRPLCVPGAPNKSMAALAKFLPDEWIMALMAARAERFRR
ncbi:MAG: SDR family NAD(P)-dependent oxidoreductase [Caulobacteraceae bacterium]